MRRNPPPRPPQTKDQTGPAPELQRIIPVGSRVNFDDGHWWITAVVIWDDRISVDSVVWDDTWSFEQQMSPARGRGAPRFHFQLLIEDELATRYSPKGGGGCAVGHRHRVAGEFEPSLPVNAAQLTIALTRRAWPGAGGEQPAQPTAVARISVDLQ